MHKINIAIQYPNNNSMGYLTKPIKEIQTDIRDSISGYIKSYQHPSVWQSIKLIQSNTHTQWMALFQKVPEALTW
ncbi:hypothetical protein LJ707_09110 [Mucilaginibacter sp. UR6-1]|uniref:hypothetical protein n=1 Tax=Mucilaginibacter sp. UR6-1 TaxID=1435643 RepID=UPI001E43BBBD|nr:hypothetical protein [Mucilaginibacter sp. UR6-1]MCC8409088.1 hypothetical protein [Mucilaginibacter sp. UR6-1]